MAKKPLITDEIIKQAIDDYLKRNSLLVDPTYTIGQIPVSASTMADADLLETEQGGVSKQTTALILSNYIQTKTSVGASYTPTINIVSGISSVTPGSISGDYIASKLTAGARIINSVSLQIVTTTDPMEFTFNDPVLANYTSTIQAKIIGCLVKNASSPAQGDGDILSLSSIISGGVDVKLTTSTAGTYNVNFSYMYRKIT